IPCNCTPGDDMGRNDLERAAISVADLGITQPPDPAIGRLVLQAAVDAQELCTWSGPLIVEGAGVSLVEVDTPRSVGSLRVGQHSLAPLFFGSAEPLPSPAIWSRRARFLNRIEVDAADSVVLIVHTAVLLLPYVGRSAHTLVWVRARRGARICRQHVSHAIGEGIKS